MDRPPRCPGGRLEPKRPTTTTTSRSSRSPPVGTQRPTCSRSSETALAATAHPVTQFVHNGSTLAGSGRTRSCSPTSTVTVSGTCSRWGSTTMDEPGRTCGRTSATAAADSRRLPSMRSISTQPMLPKWAEGRTSAEPARVAASTSTSTGTWTLMVGYRHTGLRPARSDAALYGQW